MSDFYLTLLIACLVSLLLNRGVQLSHQLFPCLFYGVPAGFHLLGKVFFQHGVLADPVMYELHGCLPGDFYGRFPFFAVVEPGLCPPPESRPVGIDSHQSGYVKTPHVYLQSLQRICDAACGYGFVKSFFLPVSPKEDRNTPCRMAR